MSESRIKSADDLIFQDEARKMGQPVTPAVEVKTELSGQGESPDKTEDNIQEPLKTGQDIEEEQKEVGKTEIQAREDTPSSDENVDEYGNPVGSKKTYTEDEVQAMIRKRLRDRHSDQPQEVQQAAQNFKPDSDSEETWEKQLGDFIENKVEQLNKKKQDQDWQQRERATQAEFESKFETGMGKYSDFEHVVSGKPITAAMMMATRDMNDPAAFLYAACKQNPAEIDRIARIQNPVTQAVEIGRLEEKMKKARVITSAPIPAKRISGDAVNDMPKETVDQKIASHAKSKIMNNRK